MKVINVYSQYFNAHCIYNSDERRAALVNFTATSDEGYIKYEASVTFFPFKDPTDFAVTYDACLSKELYNKKGRRSKKREADMLDEFRGHIDELSAQLGGEVFWEKPLRDAKYA